MRLLGAALAAAVCVSGGLLSARHLAARLRSLEGWERALMHMRCALETETAALPALLAAGATQGPAALSALKTLLDTAPADHHLLLLSSEFCQICPSANQLQPLPSKTVKKLFRNFYERQSEQQKPERTA